MLADLHTHTNASDANLSRGQLLEIARARCLDYIAITDHDTMINSFQTAADGVSVVVGVELSSFDSETGRMVHILCYLPKDREALEAHFSAIHAERVRTGEEMLRRAHERFAVVTRENVAKYTATSGVVHRQDIMNVLREFGYANEMFGALYEELFNRKTGPFHVPFKYPETDAVLRLARAARGVAVMAHPGVYDAMPAARRHAASGLLDGLEVDHPRNKTADRTELKALCDEYGLICTGGSDYHGANSHGHVLPGDGLTDEKNLTRLLDAASKR